MSFRLRLRAAASSRSSTKRVLRVGIVQGGGTTTNGVWGCDEECIENEKLCFERDARFVLKDVLIREIATDQQTLDNLDVLIMPGGNDEYDDLYGGPGQYEALGEAGLGAIQKAVRDRGMVYVGICAGAFLAASKKRAKSVLLAPSVTVHDEKNFGWASVRGWVALDVPHSVYKEILSSWWKRTVYYDDGPALVVDANSNDTQVLAVYKGKVKFEDSEDRERVKKSYWPVAGTLVGKAAVTLTQCGRGKILLIGPHPECEKPTRKALVDLIAAVACDDG